MNPAMATAVMRSILKRSEVIDGMRSAFSDNFILVLVDKSVFCQKVFHIVISSRISILPLSDVALCENGTTNFGLRQPCQEDSVPRLERSFRFLHIHVHMFKSTCSFFTQEL